MKHVFFPALLSATLLAGCATESMGPMAHVMPAQGKDFGSFAREQAVCEQFAGTEVNGNAVMANLKQFGGAALSTVLGAGLGAALHHARGAEIGGGLGAITGTMLAGRGSAYDQANLQGRYDTAYSQCMYAHGNQVAGAPPRAGYGGPQAQAAAPGGYPMPPTLR